MMNTPYEQFKKFKKDSDHGCNIKHLHGCKYESWRSVPVSECQCDCYEFAIFMAGQQSAVEGGLK